ncbi:uncharacterized protein LOC131853648 [Achroia grisella]|uniref:uncharacterized protein LOC131853648 n=1 Tax=Achroia grisella TaxID=688607 RepID=UPI0027D33512|nr:uncharacterized protein LOC131853648 [Achroia grisella]
MVRDGNRIFLNSNTLTARYKYLLFLSIICSGSFFFMALVNNNDTVYYKNEDFQLYMKDEEKVGYQKQFTIKTKGCTIPGMTPFDDSINQFVEYPKTIKKCKEHNISLVEHNKTHIWINKNKISKYNISLDDDKLLCCYKAFYRPKFVTDIHSSWVDDRVEYQKCIYFFELVEVKDEFVRISCVYEDQFIFDDYFVFAIKKDFIVHNDKTEILKNKTAYNVLIMGIDAVSRLNFYRTMPKTVNYLKTMGAIDLAGYNKVGDNTFPNLIPMLLGMTPDELRKTCLPHKKATFDNCPFIWEWFKQAGYYTALGEDSSSLGTFNYLRVGFVDTPTDYYLHTFFNEAEKEGGNNHDFNSYLCLNNKYFYNVLLDYIENLTSTLKSSKLFGFFWEITMSHDYLNYPMIMDADYVHFFKRLDNSNYLKDTILFLVSDHGIRWGDIRSTKQGYLEERLPFVFMLVPPSFRKIYTEAYNNIKLNSKRLTTPFDIHATLSDLIDLENIENDKIKSREEMSYGYNRGISLFLPIPSNRTCKIAGIKDHWCTCQRDKKIPNNSAKAVAASKHLLKYLNKILSEHIKCAPLKLVEIIEATEKIAGDTIRNEIGWREFMTVVRTKPGNGVFEGTLRLSNREWSTAGSVSRLNLYGNQSYCVDDNVIKLYCYCLDTS